MKKKEPEEKTLLEKKLSDNQRIRIAGKKFHIPKSIPTSIITFILSLILLPIVLYITFILIDYLSDLVIWYLKDTPSDLINYMIGGTLLAWLFCLIHMIFKKGEVLESILDCFENMSMLTYSIIYIITIVFIIIDKGLSLNFASLFTFLLNAIVGIFTSLGWTIVSTIIGMFVVIALSFLMRGIFKRLILYMELIKVRKSRCYKAILYLIKDYNFDNSTAIDYIFITNDRINVVDDDEEIQEIIFRIHHLPDLTQYGIAAMACLIKLQYPYFCIKSDILGLTLINTNLERPILDERTVEIKLEDIDKLTDTFIKPQPKKKGLKKLLSNNKNKKVKQKPKKEKKIKKDEKTKKSKKAKSTEK